MHNHREAFEEICKLIKSVDANGDSIMQTMKLRTVNEKLRLHVKDEKQLSELFDMINARALQDEEFILSLVMVITSVQCASFSVNGKILRHAMMSLLQKNFQNADNFKREDPSKLYNSIRLLGEFYNKAKLQNGSPINIIGQSMLNIMNVELEKELRNICHFKQDDFAKMILSQVTLNGRLFKNRQKTEIEQVLFTIRKCLIELPSLSSKTKAFLLMTMDLYYSNFTNVGHALERMYQGFLIDEMPANLEKIVENGKPSENVNGNVQESLERMSIRKKQDEGRTPSRGPPRNLRVQIRKPDPPKSAPIKSHPRSPQKTSPPNRLVPKSPQSPSAPDSPRKKLSPQDLRAKKSPPTVTETRPGTARIVEPAVQSRDQSSPVTNGTDENILRQQNSRSSTPVSSNTTPKHKVNNKVYFREENVENLTWNGEPSIDAEAEDPDASTSPKVNPYSSSFLNFLSSN